jgi:uncharacterized glyoxalase superfamily protein PhnB
MAKRVKSSKSQSTRTKAKGSRAEAKSKAAKRKVTPAKAKLGAARSNVMPCITYRDAPAAIDFLCKAFGFGKKMVMAGEGNVIAHAELTLGNAMVMLGSHKDTSYGKLVTTPREVGICTQTIYLVVPDADAHHARAKAAGAEIVIDLVTQDYGGRDYSCRDPEGHIWTFGTYDPWAPTK